VTPTITVSITPTASPTCFSELYQKTNTTGPGSSNDIKVFYNNCSNTSTSTTIAGNWNYSCITHNTVTISVKWGDNAFPDPVNGVDYVKYTDCVGPTPTPSITTTPSPTPSPVFYTFSGSGLSNVSKNDACNESFNNPVTLYSNVTNPTNGDYIYTNSSLTTTVNGYAYIAIQGTGRAINSGTGQLYSSGLDISC
jgi:hypothetical protein